MSRRLLQSTGAAAAAVRHLLWYLAYCVDGSATRPGTGPGFETDSHLRRSP